MHACMHACMHAYIHIYIDTYIDTNKQACIMIHTYVMCGLGCYYIVYKNLSMESGSCCAGRGVAARARVRDDVQ